MHAIKETREMAMLKDKIILITGAGSGIGESAAHVFSAHGARLLVTDMDEVSVNSVTNAVKAKGGDAIAMQVDVTNEKHVEAMVTKAVDHFGRLDGAFNNAGVGCPPALTADQSIEEFRKTLEIDLIGAWHCIKYEIRAMLQTGGGSIVSTASDAGLGGTPMLTPYAAAKAGLINMTRTAAMEYGQQNIRLNAVCPGPIDTPALRAAAKELGTDETVYFGGMAMKRLGKPEEVTELAAWLLSDYASFVTGQAMASDGGFNATFS
jgi:NAD(P)-dependent dehydrogenase (short-subunit alcohol dehydrogenase family)